jgi:hypothetical protein
MQNNPIEKETGEVAWGVFRFLKIILCPVTNQLGAY